jgi:HEAT repeat protein
MKRVTLFALFAIVGGMLCCSPPTLQAQEPRYGGKPLAYWVERLQNDSENDQPKAAAAIVAFGPDAEPAIPALLQMLDDRSGEFRSLVGSVLCQLGPDAKTATPGLVRLLQEKKARNPEMVVKILGRIGPDAADALPVLVKALENRSLCDAAVQAICAQGPSAKDAIPAIRQAIRDAEAHEEGGTCRSFALFEPLTKLGSDAVPLLVEFLEDKDVSFQLCSAHALGRMGAGAKAAVPALMKALKSDAPAVRGEAAQALWKIEQSTAGVPVLAALLKEKARYPAESAAQVLGEMGQKAKSALPELEEALSHEDYFVREVARQAIRNIDPELARKLATPPTGAPPPGY